MAFAGGSSSTGGCSKRLEVILAIFYVVGCASGELAAKVAGVLVPLPQPLHSKQRERFDALADPFLFTASSRASPSTVVQGRSLRCRAFLRGTCFSRGRPSLCGAHGSDWGPEVRPNARAAFVEGDRLLDTQECERLADPFSSESFVDLLARHGAGLPHYVAMSPCRRPCPLNVSRGLDDT